MVHSIANLSWSTKEAEGHEQMDYALEKELIGTQPDVFLFLHVRKHGILKELLEPGSKKTGRRESGSRD
jgi:hypothetical protein